MPTIKKPGSFVNERSYSNSFYVVNCKVLATHIYQIVIISAFRKITSSLVIGYQQTETVDYTIFSKESCILMNS